MLGKTKFGYKEMKKKIKKIILFFTNPRLLLCFFLAWLITNGWSYILFGLGTCFEIPWMTAVAGAYLAFLWLPVSPEKLVTFAIAIFLLRRLFPDDQKTLAVLRQFRDRARTRREQKRAEAQSDPRK